MATTPEKIRELISQGESSAVEFKSADVRPESLAMEMAAFSNTMGGTILVGVNDDGGVEGMERPDFDQWVANIARNNVTPAIAPQISVVRVDGYNGIAQRFQYIRLFSLIRHDFQHLFPVMTNSLPVCSICLK